MSENSQPDPVLQANADRTASSKTVLERLCEALGATLRQVERSAAGESVFSSDVEAKVALELIRLLPQLLPLLPKPPAPPPPKYSPPLIPTCPLCGQGPGAHWPRDCEITKSLPPEIRKRIR